MRPICRFCLLPDRDRILGNVGEIVTMLSLGPICEGHSLVLTRKHHSCVAEIPEQTKELFISSTEHLCDRLFNAYGPLVAFEHGRATCGRPAGKTHCHHAHLHVLPTTVDLLKLLADEKKVSFIYEKPCTNSNRMLVGLREFWKSEFTQMPYLLVMSKSGTGVHVIDGEPKHQYLRFLVARALGAPELADWYSNPRYDVIENAFQRLIEADSWA